MKQKIRIVSLTIIVLFLVSGLVSAQTQRRSPMPPLPQRTGTSFVPVVPTTLGYKASLILDGLVSPTGIGVSPQGDNLFFTALGYVLRRYDHRVVYITQDTSSPGGSTYRAGFYYGDFDGNIFKIEGRTTVKYLGAVSTGFVTALDVDPQTGFIYFTALDYNVKGGGIYKLPPQGGTPELVTLLNDDSFGLIIRGNFLYYTYITPGVIVKMPKGGGVETLVADGLAGPWDLAFDNQGNYVVAEYSGGSIARVKADSLNIVRIATGLFAPMYLQLDASGNIYFSDNGAGALWKLRRVAN